MKCYSTCLHSTTAGRSVPPQPISPRHSRLASPRLPPILASCSYLYLILLSLFARAFPAPLPPELFLSVLCTSHVQSLLTAPRRTVPCTLTPLTHRRKELLGQRKKELLEIREKEQREWEASKAT